LFDLVDTSSCSEETLIFVLDADEEPHQIEVDAVGLNKTLNELAELLLSSVLLLGLGHGKSHSGGLLSEDGLGHGLSNIESELLVVLGLPSSHGGLNLSEDVSSVDDEVLKSVSREAGWALEDLDHVLELLEVSLDLLAVGNRGLGSLGQLAKVGGALDLVLQVVDGAVGVGLLAILDNVLDVLDARLDVSESFSLNSTFKDARNDLGDLLEALNGLLGGSAGKQKRNS